MIGDGYLPVCVCACVCTFRHCPYMKVHDQNTREGKYVIKTTSSNSQQWQAVSCSES